MASSIHIGGLSSGTDYAGMIAQIMAARQVPITQKENKLQELDYDLGAWSQVQTQASDLTESLNTLRSYETWRNMTGDSSDSTVLTATADTGASEDSYTIVISNKAVAQSISSDQLTTTNDLITDGYAQENDTFNIEGETITIEAGETLSSLRTKINTAALSMSDALRVSATIVDDHLVLTREKTGEFDINISDTTGTTLEDMGVVTALGAIKNETVIGENAQFSVNGINVTRTDNTQLDDVITGVTLTIRDEGTITLDIRPDREAMKTAIEDFIEKYNSMAEMVDDYGKIVLGSSSELAQKGELYGDSLLSSFDNNLRRLATEVKSPTLNTTNASYTYEGNDGIMDSLGDIGIWTSGESNRLSITDETRLDYLLENEFDKVEQLFKGVYDENEVAYTNGIAADLYSYSNRMSQSLTGDIAKRIEALTEDYDDLSADIDEMNDDLVDYEQKQWDTFTLMEDALANMKSQTAYISSVFGQKS